MINETCVIQRIQNSHFMLLPFQAFQLLRAGNFIFDNCKIVCFWLNAKLENDNNPKCVLSDGIYLTNLKYFEFHKQIIFNQTRIVIYYKYKSLFYWLNIVIDGLFLTKPNKVTTKKPSNLLLSFSLNRYSIKFCKLNIKYILAKKIA